MIRLSLVRDITNAFGPSGFEDEVARVIRKYGESYLSIENDAMYNVYARLKGEPAEGKPVIMLDAHTDECGFMVQAIQENGLLSMLCLGGIHLTNIPAHPVLVRTRSGELIRGITTSKPVHFMKDRERNSCDLDIEGIYIDVGASSRREVTEDFGIHPGDPVVPDVVFSYDEKHEIGYGKAFDNRLGCVCILETMRALAGSAAELAVNPVGAFASQEEVGTRGALVTSQVVKPDLAIVFEGSPADDLYFSAGLAQGALKKGAQIRLMDKSYISNTEFCELARKTADRLGIPYQETVRRGGSTNAGRISLTGKAVPVLVIGVPSRYVHTHYNFFAMEDLKASVRLAAEVIKALDPESMNHILRQDL